MTMFVHMSVPFQRKASQVLAPCEWKVQFFQDSDHNALVLPTEVNVYQKWFSCSEHFKALQSTTALSRHEYGTLFFKMTYRDSLNLTFLDL